MSLRGHGVWDTCVHIAGALGGVKAEPDALLNVWTKVRPLSKAIYDFYQGVIFFFSDQDPGNRRGN